MWLGRYQLGASVPVFLRTVDDDRIPAEPADTPQLVVWAGSTEVLRTDIAMIERIAVPGLFYKQLFLDAAFAVGNYLIDFRWVMTGGYQGSEQRTFEVVPGGHADGAVVAAYFYNRPHASFVVHQAERGVLIPGKNPRMVT